MTSRKLRPTASCGESPEADRALIDACLAGDPDAWDELYHACHDKLLVAIRRQLGPNKARDTDLVDEISARVWYALICNEGALLDRFDPTCGSRLTTFLSAIAKDQMSRHFRSEARRSRREAIALQNKASTAMPNLPPVFLEDLRETLTPAECKFFDTVLVVGGVDATAAGYSQTNAWQLTCRIRKKLGELFGRETCT